MVLIRASWLLHRAGFRQIGDRGNEGSNYLWAPREPPRPLPRRQDIEREFPDAIMPLEELRAQHRNFKEVAQEAMNTAAGRPEDTTAHADGAEAMPVITISHCWERADHPDPHGETLRIVAAELADGGWDAFDERGFPVGAPTCGMPLLRAWGMEDVGVFWGELTLTPTLTPTLTLAQGTESAGVPKPSSLPRLLRAAAAPTASSTLGTPAALAPCTMPSQHGHSMP